MRYHDQAPGLLPMWGEPNSSKSLLSHVMDLWSSPSSRPAYFPFSGLTSRSTGHSGTTARHPNHNYLVFAVLLVVLLDWWLILNVFFYVWMLSTEIRKTLRNSPAWNTEHLDPCLQSFVLPVHCSPVVCHLESLDCSIGSFLLTEIGDFL